MIKITFLGTSGSVPTKSRSLPSVAVTYEGKTLLFDCGEGTQRQAMRYGINISSIKAIFITHMHLDHVIGIAGLVRTLALYRRTEPLYVFVPKGEEKGITALLNFDKALISYKIIIKPVKAGEVFEDKEFSVDAIKLNHTVPAYGYVFKERDKLRFMKERCRSLGIKGRMFSELLKRKSIRLKNGKTVRIGEVTYTEKGMRIAYVTDSRPSKDVEKAARGVELLIHEATFADAHRKLAIERKHSTAREAAEVAKSAGAKRLLLFHFSVRYKNTATLIKEAKKVFENVQAAKDGMEIVLQKGT